MCPLEGGVLKNEEFLIPQGSLSCRGERMLMVDADGATKISDMERMEKALSKLAEDHVSNTHTHTLSHMHTHTHIYFLQTVPALAVGSRAHLQEQAVAEVCLLHTK